ncbi:MAG: T9SS type A sorting domain-containing protein [Saprospiraceae bacterium]|nr:T9SS type A sorting domain-containing protein [Saprospiraceae bacterium]
MFTSLFFPSPDAIKRPVLTLICCLFSLLLAAQIATFKKTYGTAGDDEAQFVHVLSDSTFIVAGSTTAGNHGAADALLIKFDAAGNILWSATYGGASSEFFKFILACSDGNFIAYGESRSFGTGSTDLYLVKFAPDGQLIWSRTYGGSNDEQASGGLCETPNGYLVSGATLSFGAGFWDVFVVNTGFDGVAQWAKRWGTSGGDGGGEPMLAENGDVWVPGGCYVSSSNHNGILMRIQPNGALIEGKQFGGSTNEGNECLTPGGAGMTASSHTWVPAENGLHQQPWMMSYSLDGELAWSKRYKIPDGNYRINAESCPDGGFIFTPNRNGADNDVAYLIKTDQEGEVDWSFKYHFDGTGDMYHAMPCPDGGYVAVGYRNGAGRDIFLIKTNANGLILNCRPENADIRSLSATPNTYSLSFSSFGAGGSVAANSQTAVQDLTTTTICSAGISSAFNPDQRTAPLAFMPNPANDFIQIQSPVDVKEFKLSCYNVWGQCLFAKQVVAGTQVDISALPPGCYLIVAEDGLQGGYRGKLIKN